MRLDSWRARLKPWTGVIRGLIAVVVLVLLFSRVDPRRVVGVWAGIRVEWVVLALGLLVPNLFCQYRRWRAGLVRVHPAVSAKETVRVLLIGMAMGAVTPGRMGELGQVVFLPSGGRRRALGVMAVMRAYGFLTAVLLGFLMWAIMPGLLGVAPTLGRMVALALCGGVILVASLGEYVFRQTKGRLPDRIMKHLADVEDVFVGIRALTPSDRARFVAWSLLLSLVYLTQLVMLMRAFGGEVAWFPGVAAGAVTTGIVALLPIAVGNIGVRESAAILIWQHVGIAAPVAFNGACTLFLLNVILPGTVGLIWTAFSGRGPRSGRGT